MSPSKKAPDPSETPRTRAIRQIPEPNRFWIAHAPRTWRCAGGLWSDLATGQMGGLRNSSSPSMPQLEASDLDDLLYLPPVQAKLRKARDRVVASCVESGTPVLVQLVPGENARGVKRAEVIYDLLNPILAGDLDVLKKLPEGSSVVWPLIPGIGDHSDFWEEGLILMKMAGVQAVQPLLLDLTAVVRRRLAENRGDEVFDALFHGRPPSEEAFSRQAVDQGFEVFWQRPPTGSSQRLRLNRQVAAELALAGELWGRLGRSVSVGQALFRASRGAENTPQNLAALVREKNLGVMNWLDARTAEIVEEIVVRGHSMLLAELRAEYLDIPLPVIPEPEPEDDDAKSKDGTKSKSGVKPKDSTKG